MKKIITVLVIAAILCVFVSADFSEYSPDELSEAVSLLRSCGGEPDGETLEKLHGLGFTDEDIDGLSVVNSLRKDKNDFAPYIITAAVIAVLSAAAVVCVARSKKKV